MISKSLNVFIAILTTYERNGWITRQLAEFVYSLRGNKKFATALAFADNYVPAAAGRNAICAAFLSSDADWLCMIDNDMAPPANLLDTLDGAPDDAAVIIPKFHMWDGNKAELKLCWKFPEGAPQEIAVDSGFHPLAAGGTGVMFLKRTPFLDFPMPWFEYRYNKMGGMEATEDIVFTEKMVERGLKVYGNGAIRVGHFRSVNLDVMSDKWFQGQMALKALDKQQSSPVESESSACPAAVSPTSNATAK